MVKLVMLCPAYCVKWYCYKWTELHNSIITYLLLPQQNIHCERFVFYFEKAQETEAFLWLIQVTIVCYNCTSRKYVYCWSQFLSSASIIIASPRFHGVWLWRLRKANNHMKLRSSTSIVIKHTTSGTFRQDSKANNDEGFVAVRSVCFIWCNRYEFLDSCS